MTVDAISRAADRKVCPAEPAVANCHPLKLDGQKLLGTYVAALYRFRSDASAWSATRTMIGKVSAPKKGLQGRDATPWVIAPGFPYKIARRQTWTRRFA